MGTTNKQVNKTDSSQLIPITALIRQNCYSSYTHNSRLYIAYIFDDEDLAEETHICDLFL